MTTDLFRIDRPFKTKCGWPARLVGVLHRTAFQYVVAVWNPALNAEELHCYGANGQQPVDTIGLCDPKPGVGMGALSLVNDEVLEDSLKQDSLIHAHVAPMRSYPAGENVFRHDLYSMGTDLVRNWMVMHEGYSNDFPLTRLYFHNKLTGQNIAVHFSPITDVEKKARGL
jgi:hypothetical protein